MANRQAFGALASQWRGLAPQARFAWSAAPSWTGALSSLTDVSLGGLANKDMLYYALAYDPLTAAALSMQEIRAMVDELYEKEKHLMPTFED